MIFYNIQHFGDGTWLPWLLRTLSGPDNQVLITYDGSAEAMAGIAADVTRDAPALKRLEVERSLPIRWCGPSQAQMQIEALRRALKRDGWEFFVNLSGTCAPLRPQAEIRDRLARARDDGTLAHVSAFRVRKPVILPRARDGAPIETRRRKRLVLRGNAGLLDQFDDPAFFPVSNPVNRLFTLCHEPEDDPRVLAVSAPDDEDIAFRRAFFAEQPHYCGRAWYILHRSVCEALVAHFDSPAFEDDARVFLGAFEPDESFLPTLLMSGRHVPVDRVSIGNFRTYGGGPRLLTDASYRGHLADTPAFFTRKVLHEDAAELRAFVEARIAG